LVGFAFLFVGFLLLISWFFVFCWCFWEVSRLASLRSGQQVVGKWAAVGRQVGGSWAAGGRQVGGKEVEKGDGKETAAKGMAKGGRQLVVGRGWAVVNLLMVGCLFVV